MSIPGDTGLMLSLGRVFGGVRRFPKLARPPAADCGWPVLMAANGWYLLCSVVNGGGGSSKLGKFDAADLRAVKLEGMPMGSDPWCIWMGWATAAARIATSSGDAVCAR